MMGSPWDGASRRALRVGLTAICVFAVVFAAFDAHRLAGIASFSSHAPAFAVAIGGSSLALAAIAMLGVVAAVRFARRPAALGPGLALFAIMAVSTEGVTLLAGGPRREYFSLGAAFFGWLLGLAYARLLSGGDRRVRGIRVMAVRSLPEADEALAEIGAMAGLAATYMNAATSKLSTSGLGWADETSLRGIILSHHRIDDTSIVGLYARFVVEHPPFSRAMMLAALILQLGAFLYLVGPRLRLVWGLGLLAFHTNVSFLAEIGYVESRALLLLFSFPWPRIVARLRGVPLPDAPDEKEVDPRRHRFVAIRFSMAFLAAIALAWLVPFR